MIIWNDNTESAHLKGIQVMKLVQQNIKLKETNYFNKAWLHYTVVIKLVQQNRTKIRLKGN